MADYHRVGMTACSQLVILGGITDTPRLTTNINLGGTMSVTIIGTVAFDSIHTPFGTHDRILGGSATYAGTAASIFSPVHLVSIVGADFHQEHLDYFSARGISTEGIFCSPGQTFHWKGAYSGDMNQATTLQTDLNVLLEFDPQVPASAASSRIVILGNIDPSLQRRAVAQFKHPELVILDSMNFWIQSQKDSLLETLQLIDVLILNDQEIKLLTGEDNLIRAIPRVMTMGPKRVIVKKGEHGAIMYNGSEFFAVPAMPLDQVVDPTGAGDSFAGGIAGYLAGQPVLDESAFRSAVLIGTLVASFTVQDFSLNRLKLIDKTSLLEAVAQFNRLTQMEAICL
ncbi:sugar kinase [bacterium]|nr:sugar kinase [bacterium]